MQLTLPGHHRSLERLPCHAMAPTGPLASVCQSYRGSGRGHARRAHVPIRQGVRRPRGRRVSGRVRKRSPATRWIPLCRKGAGEVDCGTRRRSPGRPAWLSSSRRHRPYAPGALGWEKGANNGRWDEQAETAPLSHCAKGAPGRFASRPTALLPSQPRFFGCGIA